MKTARQWMLLWALAGSLSPTWAAESVQESPALAQAFARLRTFDWGQSHEALNAIDDAIAATRNNPAQRGTLEQRLAAFLSSPAPVAAKQFACRRLSLIGTEASVPALADLLGNAELAHIARLALERIPGTAASEALRTALPRVDVLLKVGIINSLGELADPKATGALIALLGSSDPAIVEAAVSALGKIGTLEAARALEQFRTTAPKALQSVADDACLVAAEHLVRRGERAEAARMFRPFFTNTTSEPLRLAGFRGLLLTEPEPEGAISLVARALAGDDESLRSLAGRVLAEPPGERVPEPLLGLLPSLPPEGQVALLGAIRAKPHAAARAAVLAACERRESNVRLAAWHALGMVGNEADVPRLARLSAAGSGDESAAARLALANMPGREPGRAMIALLPEVQPSVRVELIKALAARFATDVAPAVATLLKDSDASVRQAALAALAVLGDETQVSAVIAFLRSAGDDATRRAAGQAIDAIVARIGVKSTNVLLAGLKDAPSSVRIVLLPELGRLGGPQGLEAVRADLRHDDSEVRETAFRVLSDWPDAGAAPDLLKFAQQANPPARRALAFRGYVRLCRESPMPADERLSHLAEAAKVAASTDEKLLVVSALADVPEAGSLKLLTAYLDDAALVDTASIATVKVASALDAEHKVAVAPVLQQVLKVCKNPDVRKGARDVLKKLGVPSE